VVDEQVEAAPQQTFRQADHRTLAQVVGSLLEGEAEQPDLSMAGSSHEFVRPRQMALVRRYDSVEHRNLDIGVARVVGQGAHVLWETGAAERGTRREVRGR